jgi:hypothetical protein
MRVGGETADQEKRDAERRQNKEKLGAEETSIMARE